MPEERIYIIPLSDVKRGPKFKRANRAVKIVQDFLSKHMKSEEIKIDNALNQKLWQRGARKPPSRIRVKAVRQDDGSVQASLAE
jgi:large subunit ribosomal protein L31e